MSSHFFKKHQLNIKTLYPILILLLISLMGLAIRLYRIDTAPVGALIDELHFGYLAHSLIETGADEHGNPWPLIFQGFGDQKLPAMAYLDILSVSLLGLTVRAIRLPSVLAGTFLITASYWLIREIKLKKRWALLAALITAVSPWTFFLSRFGFESNLALTSFTFGLAALLRGMNKKSSIWLALAGLLLGSTWYSYIAYRPLTLGLLVVISVILHFKKQLGQPILIMLAVFVITILPLFAPAVVGVNNTRFEQVSITQDPGIVMLIDENRTFCSWRIPRRLCDLVWNKPIVIARELSDRFLATYSPNYLVSEGEVNEQFLTVEGFGQFFPILFPFFIIGIVATFVSIKDQQLSPEHRWLIWLGLILAPLPAILVGEPQKVRISGLYPFLLVLATLGVSRTSLILPKRWLKDVLFAVVTLFLLGYSVLYLVNFYSVHTVKNEFSYQSYLPAMIKFTQELPSNTIINFKPFYSDPIMFYAFYSRMGSAEYQRQAKLGELESSGFQHTVKLGRVTALDQPIEKTACQGHRAGVPAVHVTDRKIEGAVLLYEGKSTNGVHSYIYVYDATSTVPASKCPQQ